MSLNKRGFLIGMAATATLAASAGIVRAENLAERMKAGKAMRLGFANEVPWAYPGDNNEPRGFVNAIAIGVLKKMGIDKVEPVVTDWGGLIPGLNADRFDTVTGGMYILNKRCENMAFSEPIGRFGDAFIVKKGNPKGISNYKDIASKGAIMVTGAGYNTVDAAKKEGVPDANIMQVPGNTEILAAVKSGRADAGAVTFFSAQELAGQAPDEIEVTDPNAMPDWTYNWVGIGFRKDDEAFLKQFNAALKAYIGSEEMMAAVKTYGYTKAQLPGDQTTEWVCENR